MAMIPSAAMGQIWPVIALCTASSVLSSATSPTAQGLIPDVLSAAQLQAGNAIHQMSRSVTSIVGAAVGGFVVVSFSIQTALAIDFTTFILAALIYRRFARQGGEFPEPHANPAATVGRRELVRAMLTNRVVFTLAASFTLATMAIGIMNSASSKAFDDQLGIAHAYGYIVATVSAGYVASELLTGYMRRQSVARRSVGLSFVATGGAMYLLSHATTTPIAYLALFLFGASDGITEVVRDSLIQITTPRRMRSGIFAMTNSVQTMGMIVGLAIAPIATAAFSTGTVLRIVAAGCVLSGIVACIGLVGVPRGVDDLFDARRGQQPQGPAESGMPVPPCPEHALAILSPLAPPTPSPSSPPGTPVSNTHLALQILPPLPVTLFNEATGLPLVILHADPERFLAYNPGPSRQPCAKCQTQDRGAYLITFKAEAAHPSLPDVTWLVVHHVKHIKRTSPSTGPAQTAA
jgi:hypothetical protein